MVVRCRVKWKRRFRKFSRIGSICVLIALMLLQVLSLPLYAGSSIGPSFSWRLEHGRLSIARHVATNLESFYVAPNSEGLKWKPRWESRGAGDWRLVVPLWVMFGATAGWAAWAWRREKRDQGRYPNCGYDNRVLTQRVCPECGKPVGKPPN